MAERRYGDLHVQHMRSNRPFTPGAGPNGGEFFLPWPQLRAAFAVHGVELNTPDVNAGRCVDFELHLNAQRVAGNAPHARYCFIYEDPLIRPRNADPGALAAYRRIFTWMREQQAQCPNAVPLDYPNDLTVRAVPGWEGRDLHCVMLASNKALLHADARSLHAARVAVIRAFEQLAPERFALYGVGWDIPAVRPGRWGRIAKRLHQWRAKWQPGRSPPFSSYRGVARLKREVLDRARFAIAFENSRGREGYLTEKIFDCFTSGCVPVYIGAPGWQRTVPAECCIDGDAFSRWSDLVQFLDRVTPAQFADYQQAMRAFITRPDTVARFGNAAFCATLVDTILRDLDGAPTNG